MRSVFLFQNECQGGLSMLEALPEARAFDVPEFFRFQKKEQRDVLDAMLNNENNDYSTVDELAKSDRLSQYSYEVIGDAVEYLTGRGFLHKVEKPYGCVYAVNKLRIPHMMFNYTL